MNGECAEGDRLPVSTVQGRRLAIGTAISAVAVETNGIVVPFAAGALPGVRSTIVFVSVVERRHESRQHFEPDQPVDRFAARHAEARAHRNDDEVLLAQGRVADAERVDRRELDRFGLSRRPLAFARRRQRSKPSCFATSASIKFAPPVSNRNVNGPLPSIVTGSAT